MPSAFGRFASSLFRIPVLVLTLAMLFWAGNTVAARLAVGHVSPLSLVFLRWVFVIWVLWPIYGRQVRTHWPEIRPRFLRLVLMASLGFTGFNVLYYFAAYSTSAVNIGILQGSMPIFVLAGAYLLNGARPSFVQCVGALVTVAGVAVVATQGSLQALVELAVSRGDLLLLLACVLYAFYTVALRDRPAMPGAAFFTLLAAIAAITSLPLVAFEAATTGLQMPTLQGFLVTAYIAIFPSCLAQLLFLRGVDLIGPSRAGLFINLVPIFSAALGVGLLHEPFAWYHVVALVLVIGGIWLAEQTPAKRVRGTAQS